MALLNEVLTVWEIGFRLANLDDRKLWIRLPFAVRDWFRVLMDAVLRGELPCESLLLEKWHPGAETPREWHIRTYLDEIHACIEGKSFDRKLLRWAVIERTAFQQWCERRSIPLPQFWFPAGWSLDYRWPEDLEDDEGSRSAAVDEAGEERQERLRSNQRAKIAVQQVAMHLWKQEPTHTIAGLVEHPVIQQLCGAQRYASEVVRRWISEVAPTEVKEKRGRPKKKTPLET